MSKKPQILITNDDGIESEGLLHLVRALEGKADLYVVAPAIEKSGVGVGVTLHTPITIHPVHMGDAVLAWKVSGTPADCIRFGLRIVLDHHPDLIVSGINPGSNAGRNVLYSGTVGGVTEGAIRGIPGIAFSSVEFDKPRYELIASYIFPFVQHILDHPLNPGTVLNVNFPTQFEFFKGIRLARQGRGLWIEDPEERTHPNGDPYYWHGGIWSHQDEHHESDVALLNQGFVTAVPIHVDEMTDHIFLRDRKSVFEKALNPEEEQL